MSTGFQSLVFLAPKSKPSKWQLISNLKPLNKFIRTLRFWMETLSSVLHSLPVPFWVTSIDLWDAYLRMVDHQCNNPTTVSYFNMGSTCSLRLCALMWQLLVWTMDHGVALQAVRITWLGNSMTDPLSRGTVQPVEWALHSSVVQQPFAFALIILHQPTTPSCRRPVPVFLTRRQGNRRYAMGPPFDMLATVQQSL